MTTDFAPMTIGNTQYNQYIGKKLPIKGVAEVTGVIREVSVKTGVDFSYLYSKATQESSPRADAKAKGSSATGLYQFIDQTWLRMIRDHGAKYGFGDMAAAIETGAWGEARVSDKTLRHQILELRKDPEISAYMAAEFTGENKKHLENRVGGKIGKTELYLAHFLGPGGAAKFLKCMKQDGLCAAADILPDAAAANPSVFYKKTGEAKSLMEIYNNFAKKMEASVVSSPCEAPVLTNAVSDLVSNKSFRNDLSLTPAKSACHAETGFLVSLFSQGQDNPYIDDVHHILNRSYQSLWKDDGKDQRDI